MRSWLKAEDHALGTEILGTVRAVDQSEGKQEFVSPLMRIAQIYEINEIKLAGD